MMLLAYRGPGIEQGDDQPSLFVDVVRSDGTEHGAAIHIYGEELIRAVLPLLRLLGVPRKKHYGRPYPLDAQPNG